MLQRTFFEIIMQTSDFTFGGRDEVEDPLDEALRDAQVGEVTGGGSGRGVTNIDVEVSDPDLGLAVIRNLLRCLGVARSTIIRQSATPSIRHPLYVE